MSREPYILDPDLALYLGDAHDVLSSLPIDCANACITSPPYLDARPEYKSPSLNAFGAIFSELRRVVEGAALVNVGRLWRGGIEQLWWTDLLDVARLAGWEVVDTLVWVKPNANPIHGEILASSHEYVFILGRPGVTLNTDAVRTPYAPSSIPRLGRRWVNGRGVKGEERGDQHGRAVHPVGARARSFVAINVGREKGIKHPAPMALDLALHLVNLATWPGQTVIDPLAGSGTTGLAARKLGRRSILIESNEEYAAEAAERLGQLSLLA